ncbi:MAG TPA: cytochrome c3 family protein [Candidatus Angelobacter sp.]|nr:cytochrome c3 family protein [Candidatus Angelobacter sp.]
MTRWKKSLLVCLALALSAAIYSIHLIRRGFSAQEEPSTVEKLVARTVRNLSIPARARQEKNPWKATPENVQDARDRFLARCASCHGTDGAGQTQMGRNLYPKPPDLRLPQTQNLTDGEIHYIIQKGVRLTGMPAWGTAHDEADSDGWKLVLFIRSLRELSPAEKTEQQSSLAAAHYTGSLACAKCHPSIYDRWIKTPMANVVRDPREHPEAIIPDLATNPIAKFSKEQVALVYGSLWKQRYFTKIGDDYFPEPAQWDVTHRAWKPYFVAKGTDWWESFYPADNMQRPTGPTCDGCHSVDYNVHTKQVVEWNVGCERCHGPGSEHVAHPSRGNILNPARLDYVQSNDTCIQCHSQGRPLQNPIEGRYYDWPVGYRVGLNLRDFWQLEEHTLGQTGFTHFADGTAHKNRMQGNDFTQSLMYRRGVTCFTCHDVHGTKQYAQLRKPADQLCLDCHGPLSPNGPRTATLEEHTHHKAGSTGSQCIACHMPKIETTLGDVKVRAHTFAFISPALTDKYQIPNPCTSCHTDKSTAWALEAMRRWPERSPWRLN